MTAATSGESGPRTAHLYWDQVWRTQDGRSVWSAVSPWVAGSVPALHDRGVRDVLDLGCGAGRHTLFLAERGFRTTGLDRSPTAVEHTRSEAAARGLDVRVDVGDVTDLPLPDAGTDLVLAYNVVYHGDEETLSRTLAEIRRILRPGGLYHCTMLSKRNREYGRGTEIAPNAFVQPDAVDDKVHPHLYLDAADLVRLHRGFQLRAAVDVEHDSPGSFHWHCEFECGPAIP